VSQQSPVREAAAKRLLGVFIGLFVLTVSGLTAVLGIASALFAIGWFGSQGIVAALVLLVLCLGFAFGLYKLGLGLIRREQAAAKQAAAEEARASVFVYHAPTEPGAVGPISGETKWPWIEDLESSDAHRPEQWLRILAAYVNVCTKDGRDDLLPLLAAEATRIGTEYPTCRRQADKLTSEVSKRRPPVSRQF